MMMMKIAARDSVTLILPPPRGQLLQTAKYYIESDNDNDDIFAADIDDDEDCSLR